MDGQQSSSFVQAPELQIVSTLSDSSGVANGTQNTNSPVPAFEQASDSTEIGSYSHKVFFRTTTEETENHQSANNEVSIISALI
jgi:BRCT domain type II-containing protein